MKTTKIALTALASLSLLFVACSDEVAYEPAPTPNPTSNKVYFPTQTTKVTLGITDDTVEVLIARKVATQALTVKLNVSETYEGLFTAPSSVTFAAGDTVKSIFVKVGEVEFIKNYAFSISIADQNQIENPYIVGTSLPTISFNVIREDFKPYAEGTFASEFFGDAEPATWDAILEYSEATEQYRLSDCWYEGYDVLFTWDGGASVTVKGAVFKPGSTAYTPAVQSGYVHSSHGMVWAIFDGANSYDEATKTFTFPITWRVTAGSFGVYTEQYTINQLVAQ